MVKIVIDGKEIEAGNPKAIVWRRMGSFSFTKSDDVVEEMAELIAMTFAKDEVTADKVMENVPLMDIPKLYKQCCVYVLDMFTNAMEQVSKNGEAGA